MTPKPPRQPAEASLDLLGVRPTPNPQELKAMLAALAAAIDEDADHATAPVWCRIDQPAHRGHAAGALSRWGAGRPKPAS